MQRREESGQPAKGRRKRAIRPKARKSSAARLSNANLHEELDQRTRERDEALEQLAATSDVLRSSATRALTSRRSSTRLSSMLCVSATRIWALCTGLTAS
jgi:hypothetical protein